MWPIPQFPVDLVKFTEEILNGKLLFLFSAQFDNGSNFSYFLHFLDNGL